ncbi:MAG: galactokinase [Methylotenera sp.]|uniref:galactokinase n=1 Tax=Methylotenera sp. TaxID=2051956 RepID=UPI00248944F4|nr:galactokinase [Methylotenera sp.]MDI1310342.1 galactokinase [Methylotenera sp.]
MKTFEEIFKAAPTVMAEAPGRVNLLGEHTDYNGGYVLPTAISQKTCVLLHPNKRKSFRLYAATLDEIVSFTMETPPKKHFASYIYGCLHEVKAIGADIPFMDIYVHSTVPIEVGLSSSAALEVATLRALRILLQLPVEDIMIAKMAQRAEVKYAGVNCGIMDQMASSLADVEHMLFIDTRTLETEVLPLPADAEVLVIDSGISRTLAASKYNERRAECIVAAQQLGVEELRDITDPNLTNELPSPFRERARHVIKENNRVLAARKGISAVDFGQLMNASHTSLSQDYEVSIPELDLLVALLQKNKDVYGARLTGAGFGGACVALCKTGTVCNVSDAVLKLYNEAGNHGKRLVPAQELIAEQITTEQSATKIH